MERQSYPLKKPITLGSETISEFSFRNPKAKDFRGFPLEGATMDHIFMLIARLSGQSPAAVDELESEDLTAISEMVGKFMPAGPVTGGKR